MNPSCLTVLLLLAGFLVHAPSFGDEPRDDLETLLSVGNDGPVPEQSRSMDDLASLRDTLLAREFERRRLAELLKSLEINIAGAERRVRSGRAHLEPHHQALGARVSVLHRVSNIPRGVVMAMPAPLSDVHRSSIVAHVLVRGIEEHMKDMTRRLAELSTQGAVRDKMASDRRDALAELRAIEADIHSASERVREILEPVATKRKQAIEGPARLSSYLHRLAAQSMTQANVDRPLMMRDIESHKGSLPFPAHGVADGQLRLRIATAPEEPVITPHDGIVLHSGPVNGSGPLLVIDHGDNYQTVFLGLGHGDVRTGQWLLAGQPVASMATDDTDERTLYVELRHRGVPVDITGWFTATFNEESDE